MCYSAAVPLAVYGVLLGLNVIDRSDANVAALMLAETVAVVLTVWGTIRRYRPRWHAAPAAELGERRGVPPGADRRGRGRVYDEHHHPRQRASDSGWRYWLGWFWRHVVPAGAILVAAFAANAAHDASTKAEHNAAAAKAAASEAQRASAGNRRAVAAIQEGRRAAIGESCRQDEQLADVVRKALLGFGVGRDAPAPPEVRRAFRPLGGLRPLTPEEQRERCDARVARGGP